MCNAWNHSPACPCGFGGISYKGGGGRDGVGTLVQPYLPPTGLHTFWDHRDEDFCRSTTCPECGSSVYFVRHNGGSVWFDDLGPPWPKHFCFADNGTGAKLRSLLRDYSEERAKQVFGVVLETIVVEPGQSGRVIIRCNDNSIIDEVFDTEEWDLTTLVGSLVVVQFSKNGSCTLLRVG